MKRARIALCALAAMVVIAACIYFAPAAEAGGESENNTLVLPTTGAWVKLDSIGWSDNTRYQQMVGASNVGRIVDAEAGVVCWTYQPTVGGGAGLSCLPIGATKLAP